MDVLMPQLGETVSEGKIVRWFKAVGDAVAPGDNLCEIETDKVTVEVPAISAGVLSRINAPEGTVAPVGAVIAVLDGAAGTAGAQRENPAPPPASQQPPPPSARPRAPAGPVPSIAPPARIDLDPFREVQTPRQNYGPARLASGAMTTPLARRLAADAAIDLTSVAGTGARGRITGKDVGRALASRPVATPSPARVETFGELIGDVHRSRPHRILPIDGMRRTIATRLGAAKATVPHFYLSAPVDIDQLTRVRKEINAGAPRGDDGHPVYRLSINDFMIRALALALQQVPHANAIWSGDGVLAFEHSDIGVAVAVPGGLLTPVVTAAEQKSLSSISNEIKALAARARERSLRPEEYQGGVSTVSNLGMYGVHEFSAIINPPQSSILALGAPHRQAVETEDGGVAFVGQISATLSCDHRVIDGVVGAELLQSFTAFVENPLRMVV